MNTKEFSALLAESKLKMAKTGVAHKITDKCYVFTYIRSFTEVKVLKEIVANGELSKIFDVFFITTVTTKQNTQIAHGQVRKMHTVKVALWSNDTPKNNPLNLALPLPEATDILRDKFKGMYFNAVGDLLKPLIFPKETKRQLKELKPKPKLVSSNGKPLEV